MLSSLLSKEECAKCQICCCFDSSDIWETPVINQDVHDLVLKKYNSEQKFIERDDHFLLRLERKSEDELYFCSMLDKSCGCVMGDKKPFDCKIWPLRVMDFMGKRVITLSPICPSLMSKPINELMETVKKLAPVIFSEAEKDSAIVKEYISGYPILAVQ